ncbi:hypothetical protein BJ878DRAFT_424512, partial [Calycina marina]
YPCVYCNKYKGERSFVRRDHLLAHLGNFHHIEAVMASGSASPNYCLHDEHNETPFSCLKDGCFRVERLGYFREKHLLQHRRDVHSL